MFRAEPTWPTSVRSSVSRSGTRSASSMSPVASGQLGDVVGGRRDLAQRPQLTAYDDTTPATAGGGDAERADQGSSQTISREIGVVDRRGRQPGDEPAAGVAPAASTRYSP